MILENKNNGIIIVDKESGISSYDVIRKLKKILGTSKIGHTGTLDPLAEGVMVVCVEKTTKLAEKIEAQEKTYIAEMTLGFSTDTYDTEGIVINKSEKYSVTEKDLEGVFSKYSGKVQQIPPMYSAIKKDGKKLYELARKGIEIERAPRAVNIEYIKLLSFCDNKVIFETKVSKGTYIRTLINDIGNELGCYAVMSGLKRTGVGEYSIKNSYKICDIEMMAKADDYSFFIRVEEIFKKCPEYLIKDDKDYCLFTNGNTVVTDLCNVYDNVRVYYKDEFIGIGKMSGRTLKGDKYF